MSDIKVQTVRAEVSPRQVSSTPPPGNDPSLPESAVKVPKPKVNVPDTTTVHSKERSSNEGQGAQGKGAFTSEEVEAAVAKLNDYVQSTERRLDFQVDEDSGRSVIKVFDKETEELVRQIPSEQALELARRLGDEEPSFLFNAEV